MPVPVSARSKAYLRPLACWYCRFESQRRHGCLSVVTVVCCQVEVSATGWSLSIGILPTAVRRCVWSRNLLSEEAMTHSEGGGGLMQQKETNMYYIICIIILYFMILYYLPDCWLEVSIRKVLRPATSTQVFHGFSVSIIKCWDGSLHSKLPLHASHVALQT